MDSSVKSRIVFPLDDKETLIKIFSNLSLFNDKEIFVFLDNTQDCGVAKIPLLQNFNYAFEGHQIESRVITIAQNDFKNMIIIDNDIADNMEYPEIGDGNWYIEIDAYGDLWSKIRI